MQASAAQPANIIFLYFFLLVWIFFWPKGQKTQKKTTHNTELFSKRVRPRGEAHVLARHDPFVNGPSHTRIGLCHTVLLVTYAMSSRKPRVCFDATKAWEKRLVLIWQELAVGRPIPYQKSVVAVSPIALQLPKQAVTYYCILDPHFLWNQPSVQLPVAPDHHDICNKNTTTICNTRVLQQQFLTLCTKKIYYC
jgi:hypothetical protein